MTFFLRTALLLLLLSNNLSAQFISPSPGTNQISSVMDTECKDPAFLRYYGRLLNTDYGRDIVSTPGNGSIAVGFVGNNGRSSDALVMCLDSKGDLIWKKQWGLESTGDIFSRVIRLRDNNYLAMGYMIFGDSKLRLWIVKFDITGATIFSKYIPLPNGIATQGFDICETSDGGYAIAGSKQTVPNIAESIIIRLNANADVLWVVSSNNPLLNSGKTFSGIIEHEGNLVVAGYISHPSYDKDGLIMKLNSATGNLIWQKSYDIDNMVIRFNDISEINGTYFIDASRTIDQSFDGLQQCIMQLNPDGSVKNAFRMDPSIPESFPYHSMVPLAAGGFITTQSVDYGSKDILLFKISPTGTVEWKKKYTQVNDQQIFRIKPTPDNGIIGIGNLSYPNNNTPELLIVKTTAAGDLGQCVSTDHPLSVVKPTYTTMSANIILNNFSMYSEPAAFSVFDVELQTYSVCYGASSQCGISEISGPDKVCNPGEIVEFYARRSAGCFTPVRWQTNEDYFRVVSGTDSTIRVFFKKSGTTTIQAKPDENCSSSYFSLGVTINKSPGLVDLGPDLKICPLNTLSVNAGSGYESYLWGDGSTGSKLSVSNPGRYVITATDFCGAVYVDEIEILNADESFDLGPDRFVCDNDSLIIRLPAGYSVSGWLPQYNSSLIGNNAVTVSPAKDTSYIISSLLYPGCLKSDTVRISVKQHLPLSLGNDTSICEGQFFVFSAPAGFATYLWSDNSTDPSFTVSGKSNYWLQATAPNGCVSEDTLRVTAVYPKPVIGLGKQMQICEASHLEIKAGHQFVSYQWQDGSSQNTLVTNKTGKYWVDVVDRNGCIGTDTAYVTGYLPAPKGFLDKTELYEICINGRAIELSAEGNWNSYLWSTGSTGKFTKTVSPGIYWLEVTNASNCRAKDSIVILEKPNCLQGLHFPNAFTPNADGKNDVFRPVCFFIPESYLLVVFDRYGGKVFESRDPDNGWTGEMNGKSAGNNTFTWYCKYKFPGNEHQVAKGTVTVIK
jgi:gliding motility-associated-like protein